MTEIQPRPGPREVLRRAQAPTAVTPEPELGMPVQPEREFTVEARSQWSMIRRRFFRHKLAVVSLFILILVVLFAFVGPHIWKYSYLSVTHDSSKPPSWKHPFGTDAIGHDMLARVMRGTQKSLMIAFSVAFISTTIGVVVGAIAGYFRGWTDSILMRFVDLMLTIPLIAIAGALSGKIKGQNNWWIMALILAFVSWLTLSRLVRAEFLSLREKEFVEAARAVGASDRRIILKHMLPNTMGVIIVSATLTIAAAILIETALSFVGLGVRSPDTSLGLIVNENQGAFSTRPWLFWFPGLFILLIALAVNFVGDGLRDAFDPKQTRVRA